MDDETKAAFADVSAALGTIDTMLGEIIAGMATAEHLDAVLGKMDGMATKAQLDALEALLMTGHRNIQHTVLYTQLAADRFNEFWKD
jgi:hypothetical protein